MKKTVLLLLILRCFIHSGRSESKNWHEKRSTHFIVYFRNAPLKFVYKVIDKAEDYYRDIADSLGFRRYQFWLWENRAKIYIYDEAQGYQQATGSPKWSYGHVMPRDKIIHSFYNERRFIDQILPHELGHIIFREFVGFENTSIPLWLDEGVACYQEFRRRPTADAIVRAAIEKGKFIDLERLSSFTSRSMADDETVQVFYAESVSLIAFLIAEYGNDRFVVFCRRLRDKKDFLEALKASFRVEGLKQLEEAWKDYLFR